MPAQFGCADLITENDARNLSRFNRWVLLAGLFFVGGMALIVRAHVNPFIGWLLVIATAATALMSIAAYIRFIATADELLRKIQLDGLAIGFGGGTAFMLVYRLCERLGAPKLDVSDPLAVMMLCWAAGQWLSARRYTRREAEA